MQPACKNRNLNEQYCLLIKRKKLSIFFIKNPSATKQSPPSYVYYMEFYRNFLFEYSLIGIVKPKFTRRNEIRCRKSVQKCVQNAGSKVLNGSVPFPVKTVNSPFTLTFSLYAK